LAHALDVAPDAAADLDLGAGIGMAGRLGQHVAQLAVRIVGEEAGRGVGRDARARAAADQVADAHAEAAGDGVEQRHVDGRQARGELVADAQVIERVAQAGLDMVEVEHALAQEERLDHAEVFAGDEGIAEGLADARHAAVGLDLDQAAVPLEAAAARHAVGLLRGEGIFKSDERKAPDGRHGSSCERRAMVGPKPARRQPFMSIPTSHRRVVLVRRPPGEPVESDFRVEETPMPEPKHGQVLVKVAYLSLDPYQRGRMRDAASYAAPVGLGEVMTGGTVGEVVKSNNPRFAVGDFVEDRLGWQEYAIGGAASMRKVDPSLAPISTANGVLGMPGMTAYFGLLEVGQPKPGETI